MNVHATPRPTASSRTTLRCAASHQRWRKSLQTFRVVGFAQQVLDEAKYSTRYGESFSPEGNDQGLLNERGWSFLGCVPSSYPRCVL